jgi:hypothetical protein
LELDETHLVPILMDELGNESVEEAVNNSIEE